MHYSGILVRSIPARFDACVQQVDTCEGAEVYLRYPSTSCLVAVLESDDLAGQEAALRAIQGLPAVASADLVYHRSAEIADTAEMAR